ncbi:MAG: SDR family oxidoreductase [Desulfurococcaceae archaeon]
MPTLRVLVTGSSGLLGEDVAKVLKLKGHEVIEVKSRKDLDLTDSSRTIEFIERLKPDAVIHCAGTHDVDECEKDPVSVLLNTVLTTRNISLACRKVGCVILYPGSDYIFDGMKNQPYLELDLPNPVNSYGRAKLAAEREIMSLTSSYFIVRVPVLFGAGGYKERNIIYNTYMKLKRGELIKAAHDQVSSCGYTRDIAEAFERILRTDYYGIYHVANEGFCSRYEMYREIAIQLGFPEDMVIAVHSSEIERLARRPLYTVVNTSLAEKVFGLKLRHWKRALEECIREFKERHGIR